MIKLRSKNAIRAKKYGKKLTYIDKLILMRSKLHVHSELQFSDTYDNVSFSATMQDGSNCARFKQIKYSHPERWDTVCIETTELQEETMYNAALALQDTPYDLFGLLSLATPLKLIKPSRKAVWCSEVCIMVLKKAFPDLNVIADQTAPTELDSEARHYFK